MFKHYNYWSAISSCAAHQLLPYHRAHLSAAQWLGLLLVSSWLIVCCLLYLLGYIQCYLLINCLLLLQRLYLISSVSTAGLGPAAHLLVYFTAYCIVKRSGTVWTVIFLTTSRLFNNDLQQIRGNWDWTRNVLFLSQIVLMPVPALALNSRVSARLLPVINSDVNLGSDFLILNCNFPPHLIVTFKYVSQQRLRIEDVLDSLSVPGRGVSIWPTNGSLMNIAASGATGVSWQHRR